MAGLGRLTLDLVAQTASFTEPMKKAGDSAVRESQRIEASVGSAMNAIKGLGAAAVAGITISSVIQTADSYVQMAAQIENATSSQQEYEQVQKHLLETANTTYRSLKEAQQVYLDVGTALKAYGTSTEDALRITDSLSFSFTHNATAADKAKSATDAFMKSIYSNKVGGDQFVTMLSAIPSIVDDLSASMGKSKDEILTLGNAGKITGDQLKKAFNESREKSEELANNMSNSLADGMNNLSNAWSMKLGEINKQFGITNTMAAGLGVVAGNLDKIAIAGAALAAVYTLRLAPSVVLTGVSFASSTIAAMSHQLALARVAAQAAGTSTALTILGGVAMGPIGLVAVAAAVTVGYLAMRDSTAKATEKLVEQAAVADKTREELLKLQGVQKQSAINDLTDAFEAQNKELRKSELAMGSRLIAIQNSMKGDVEATRISNEARLGTLSYKDAIDQLNKLPISTELYKALQKEALQYEENRGKAQKTADALGVYGNQVRMAGNAASNAAGQIDQNTGALNANAQAAVGAASAYDTYMSKLRQSATDAKWIANYAKEHNISTAKAKVVYDAAVANGGKLNSLQVQEALALDEQAQSVKKLDDARSAAARNTIKSQSATSAAAKRAAAELNRAAEAAKRAAAEQAKLREQISYGFASDTGKMNVDYIKKTEDINRAGFSGADQKWYLQQAKDRHEQLSKLVEMQFLYEIAEHGMMEDQKLRYSFAIRKQDAIADTSLTEKQREQKLQSLQEQHEIAMKWQQLEELQTLNSAQSAYQTDIQRITSKYALEREQIALTYQYDEQMKNALLGASYYSEDRENDGAKRGAWMQYQSATGIDTGADEERARREEAIQAAWEWQLITQEEYQQKLLESEQQFFAAKAALQLGGWEQIASGTSSIMSDMFGKQSKAHQIAFAAEKGFVIAQSALAIQQSIAKAMSLGFPQNIPVIGQAVMEGAKIVSTIKSIAAPVGMAHDGIANIPTEGTWLLNKGERVLNPQDNKAFTQFINQDGGAGVGSVYVEVNIQADGSSSVDTQGQARQLGDMIGNAVRTVIRQEQRQGGMLSR